MTVLDDLRVRDLGIEAGRASSESDSSIGNPTSATIEGKRVKNGNFVWAGKAAEYSIRVLVFLSLAVSGVAAAESKARDELKAFPEAPAGQQRHVIFLPKRTDEDARRVGVIVGRTELVDCNRHTFSSRLEKRTVDGWGYDYYVVTGVGVVASTRMACPDNTKKKTLVRSSDEPLLRYNSRLPLVVFAPVDVEIRYRVWKAGPERPTD